MNNFQILKDELTLLSVRKTWPLAKKEWELERIYIIEDPDDFEMCLCGHTPIKEVCVIKNKFNDNIAHVGNCCINHFLKDGIGATNPIFQAAKKVKADPKKSLHITVLDSAFERNVIDQRSYEFYSEIKRKRKLTPAQLRWKMNINLKIINWVFKKI